MFLIHLGHSGRTGPSVSLRGGKKFSWREIISSICPLSSLREERERGRRGETEGRLKLCGSRGDADAAAAAAKKKKNTFQREIKLRLPRRGVLLRRGEAERLAPRREKRREGEEGEERLHQSAVVTSTREGAK